MSWLVRRRGKGREMEVPNSSPENTGRETQEMTRSSSWRPNASTVIRKRILVGCLGIVLAFVWLSIKQTVLPIQWQPSSSGGDMGPLCWPKVRAYLFLITELSVLFTVTLFLFMVPGLIIVWSMATVGYYIWYSFRFGQERKTAGQKKFFKKSADSAKEMVMTTIQSAVREGKTFGVSVLLALFLLAWVLGKYNIFAGRSCN